MLGVASAQASPFGQIEEFGPAGGGPLGITTGLEGNLWFTEPPANKIGEISPITHTIEEIEFEEPSEERFPTGITTGPEGNLWFAENFVSKIGELSPIKPKEIHEYATKTPNSGPNGIVAGPEGNLWFTEYEASKIGKINPAKPTEIEDFEIPAKPGEAIHPLEITRGQEGDLWFTEFSASKIGKINPAKPTEIEQFEIPAKDANEVSHPFGITTGREGNLWFTIAYTVEGSEEFASFVGEINPTTHKIEVFNTPSPKSFPSGIKSGLEGNLWFTEGEAEVAGLKVGKIGEINPTKPTEPKEFAFKPETPTEIVRGPAEITLGNEGNLWFAELEANRIGTIGAGTGTCGQTSVGNYSDPLAANLKRVNECELPLNASVTGLTVYLAPTSTSGEQPIKGVIYANAAGRPGALLGATEQLTFKSTNAAGWYHLAFSKPLELAAGEYWIGTITGASAKVASERYASVEHAEDYNGNTYASGPSNPFGELTRDNEQMSLYATYSATGPQQCGKRTVGTSSDTFASERKRVNRCVLPVAGSVSKLSVYLAPTWTSGAQVLKGVIYSDAGGKPETLLGESQPLTFKSTNAAGWYDLPFSSAVKLAAGNYWIGLISGATSQVAGFRYYRVENARDYNTNAYASGPSSPFGPFATDSEQMSLFATYTPE